MIARLMIDKRPVLRLLAFLAVAVLALGVCASCNDSGHGWSQEGGDSSPYWR